MVALETSNRRWADSPIPLLIARLILGGLFVYMGVHKIGDPVAFMKQIHLYDMLPTSPGIYLNATAIVLPWIEVVSGVCLLLGVLIRGSALVQAVMLATFTPAILLRALAVMHETGQPFTQIAFDCGCGAGEVIIWKKLLENTGLFVLALIAIFSRSRRFCLANGCGKTTCADVTSPTGDPPRPSTQG